MWLMIRELLLAVVFFGLVFWLLWPDTFFIKRTFKKKKEVEESELEL